MSDQILAVRRGDMSPQLQNQSLSYDPDGGYVVKRAYRNFDYNQMLSLYYSYAAAGVGCEFNEEFGIFELHTTDTRGQERIDRWEVQIDEEQPSDLQNPVHKMAQNGYKAMLEYDLDVIARALHDGTTLAEAQLAMEDDGDIPATNDLTQPETSLLFKQMVAGQTQYQCDKLIVVHTTNVSNRYQLNIADVNVNRLYSQPLFMSECRSSNLWVFPMPGALQYAITYFYNTFMPYVPPLPARQYYFWSWLKSGSPRVTVANNRVDIVTKFKLDQWPTNRYLLAT
jgi:hypothetical protein